MTRKLSRRSKQRIARNLGLLESIATFADSISEESITDLVRRDAIGIGNDGFPSNSMPEHSGGSFSGSSTESAALFGLPGAKGSADDWDKRDDKRRSADEVRAQLEGIEQNLQIAHKALKEAAFSITHINKKTEQVKGRQVSTPCEICGVHAAQKAGWCIKDYEEWETDGKPDRTMYAMWRRQDKNSEGIVLVPTKPKAKVKT